jgi:1,6-anhydro-N-acetylmuramate kinase
VHHLWTWIALLIIDLGLAAHPYQTGDLTAAFGVEAKRPTPLEGKTALHLTSAANTMAFMQLAALEFLGNCFANPTTTIVKTSLRWTEIPLIGAMGRSLKHAHRPRLLADPMQRQLKFTRSTWR